MTSYTHSRQLTHTLTLTCPRRTESNRSNRLECPEWASPRDNSSSGKKGISRSKRDLVTRPLCAFITPCLRPAGHIELISSCAEDVSPRKDSILEGESAPRQVRYKNVSTSEESHASRHKAMCLNLQT